MLTAQLRRYRMMDMSLRDALCLALALGALLVVDLQAAPREVFVALRADDLPGCGTAADPFNGKGPDQLDQLFKMFGEEYGDRLSISFGPGTYYGTRLTAPKSDWSIRGAGIDKTVFKTAPNAESVQTFGFRAAPCEHFRLSDLTFDFNIAALRKANRAYLWHYAGKPVLRYFYADSLPPWESGKDYFAVDMRRRSRNAARYDGVEYIQIRADPQRDPPKDNFTKWRRLWPTDCTKLPAWSEGRDDRPGDAVRCQGGGYICLADSQQDEPAPPASRNWARIDSVAPDPRIHPHAAFIRADPPGGNHVIERVKAIHTNGSRVHDRENFVLGLGGDNCIIRDCIIEQVHGDYASEIVVFQGAGNRVTGCKVLSNGANFAYGGWGCYDTLFDNNYAENVCSGVNIDSLTNRNVVFRGNTFKRCHRIGLLVSVSGNAYTSKLAAHTMLYRGKSVSLGRMEMDGLLIERNTIEMLDGAPFGAVQVQAKGLKNVVVQGNRLSRTPGESGAVAVGVFKAQNVRVLNNVCDPGMTLKDESPSCTFEGNRTTAGAAVEMWQHMPRCRARIDVRGDVRLRLTGRQSFGVTMKHPPWMKDDEKLNALWSLSPDLGDRWETMRISFVPVRDGTVALFLMGRYQTKSKETGQYEPLWACFDAIEVTGAVLENADFEEAEGKRPAHWEGLGKYVADAGRAASGSGYALGWLRAGLHQPGIKVKAGQPVTLKVKVRAATDADLKRP